MADRKKKQPRDSTFKATEKVRTEYRRQLAKALELPTDATYLNSWSALLAQAAMCARRARRLAKVIDGLEKIGMEIRMDV